MTGQLGIQRRQICLKTEIDRLLHFDQCIGWLVSWSLGTISRTIQKLSGQVGSSKYHLIIVYIMQSTTLGLVYLIEQTNKRTDKDEKLATVTMTSNQPLDFETT